MTHAPREIGRPQRHTVTFLFCGLPTLLRCFLVFSLSLQPRLPDDVE